MATGMDAPGSPSVGGDIVDRDRALRAGVTTEIVDLVIESYVLFPFAPLAKARQLSRY